MKILHNILLLLLFISPIIAEDRIDIKATPSRDTVAVNENFQINIEISGNGNFGNVNIDDKNFKADPSFFMQCISQSSSYSIVNGVSSNSLTFVYIARFSKEGSFDVGPFAVYLKNHKFESETFKVNVAGSINPQKQQAVLKNEKNSGDNSQFEINDNICSDRNHYYMLERIISKKEVYENEFIDVEINFYSIANKFRGIKYQRLEFPDASWIEKMDQKKDESVIIDNNEYVKCNFERMRVYILKSGTYRIQPVVYDFEGITPTSFFPENLTLKSKPFDIVVKSMPKTSSGSPCGNVGLFKLTTECSPTRIKVKEPATLKIKLEGQGNFQNINDFNFKVDDSIEVYSSKSNVESEDNINKVKTWEIILVPSRSGKFRINVDNFQYFDINQKKYVSIKPNEYFLDVSKAADTAVEKDDSSSDAARINPPIELNEINYIKLSHGEKFNGSFFSFWSYFILYTYILLILSLLGFLLLKFVAFQGISKRDIFIKKNAYKKFIRNINVVKFDCNKISLFNCIDNISNIIEKYFTSKFAIDSIEFTTKGAVEKLQCYLTEGSINRLKSIVNKIDMIRFGGNAIAKDDLINFINDIKNFIKEVEINNNKEVENNDNRIPVKN